MRSRASGPDWLSLGVGYIPLTQAVIKGPIGVCKDCSFCPKNGIVNNVQLKNNNDNMCLLFNERKMASHPFVLD